MILTYWRFTKSPLYSFLFTIPLFFIYEIGVFLTKADDMLVLRNGADALMRQILENFGIIGLHGIGAVFLIEMLSVVVQVGSFKLTGQRVFKMAPLHHHFELLGWSEPKIISRFLIAAIVFALFSLATLKLR